MGRAWSFLGMGCDPDTEGIFLDEDSKDLWEITKKDNIYWILAEGNHKFIGRPHYWSPEAEVLKVDQVTKEPIGT